jgi:hypothetical protein
MSARVMAAVAVLAMVAAAAAVPAVAASVPAATAPAPKNLFGNGSFELGRDGWNFSKAGGTNATWTIDNAEAAAGQASALVTVESVAEWGVQFGQTMEAGAKGKTYTFAAVVKAVKNPAEVRLEIERSASPWDRAAASEKTALKPGAWTELHVTFKVEKDFKEGWFAYVSCAQAGAQFRVDAFRLYEGEYVPYDKAPKEEAAPAAGGAAGGVALYDTGSNSAAPLPPEAVAARKGWTAVKPEPAAKFKGDAVIDNGRLALVLRRGGRGAELYTRSDKGSYALRATLAPAAVQVKLDTVAAGGVKAGIKAGDRVVSVNGQPVNSFEDLIAQVSLAKEGTKFDVVVERSADARLDEWLVASNAPAAVAVDADFKAADGGKVRLRYELAVGQPFVKTESKQAGAGLVVEASCRTMLMPDFFADDIVVDAADIPVARADLPSDSFLVHLLEGGDAMLMTVSKDLDQDVRVALGGQGADRRFLSSTLSYGKDGRIWVAVLEAPGIWHRRQVAKADTGKVIPLEWKAPYAAAWRMDWRKTDGLVDSWEVITERSGGSQYDKPGLFGDGDRLGADRSRWTTVLGTFKYPVWIDRAGQGFIQPLKNEAVRFEGPAVLYPINRTRGTPLDAFTVEDVARATLGVGPCEYILDVENQGSSYKGRATCSTRDTLRPIYEAHQQKAKRVEIEKVLTEVQAFVKHIRGRIDAYVDFGHKTRAYLEEQKKADPGLADFAAKMDPLLANIDKYVAKRPDIKTPEYFQGLVDRFRKTVLDNDGPDAYEKCKALTEEFVVVGGNQDELAGECRMAVKIIRQQAGLAMATDPRAAKVAEEIRSRTQQVLRNPAGHEGARH